MYLVFYFLCSHWTLALYPVHSRCSVNICPEMTDSDASPASRCTQGRKYSTHGRSSSIQRRVPGACCVAPVDVKLCHFPTAKPLGKVRHPWMQWPMDWAQSRVSQPQCRSHWEQGAAVLCMPQGVSQHPDLSPPDASSRTLTPHPKPRCDNQKRLHTLPNVPRMQNQSRLRTTD